MPEWTQERVHEIVKEMKLPAFMQGEIAGYLHAGDVTRARMTLVGLLDERVWARKISLTKADALYEKLGYSWRELILIRHTCYDPRFGIGFRPKEADG